MTTRYTIPTDADYWGGRNDINVDGEAVAKFVAALLEKYCQFNGYNVEIDLVPETMSYGNRASGNDTLIEELSMICDIGTAWRRSFTAADIAETLEISQRQVTNLAVKYGLGKKIGRTWFFGMSDALNMFDRKTKPGPSPTAS
jgi:hypothetical protein